VSFREQAAALARRSSLLDAFGLDRHPPPPKVNLRRRAARSAANALAAHYLATTRFGEELVVRSGNDTRAEATTAEAPAASAGPPQAEVQATAAPKPKKEKGRGIPAARVAELVEALRAFMHLESAAAVGLSEIAHCQALDIGARDGSVEAPYATAAPLAAARPSSGKKRLRNNSEGPVKEDAGAENDGEEEEEEEKEEPFADADGPEAALMQRLGLVDGLMKGGRECLSESSGSREPQRAAVQTFVEAWRRLFLEAVQPALLPEGWQADRPVWSTWPN
jgi:hypothetical protein